MGNRRFFETLGAMPSSAYWGEHGDWWVVAGQHRESDSLSRSNYRVMLARLQADFPDCVKVERFSCSLVGWRDHLIVKGFCPLRAAYRIVSDLERKYPVLDESDWSELESEDFWAWAESELKPYGDNWGDVLSDVLQDREGPNASGGAEAEKSIGWDCIEAAKSILTGEETE